MDLNFDEMPQVLRDIHDLFKTSAEAFNSAATMLEDTDPIVHQVVSWSAAALGMAHMTFDRHIAEQIAERN